MPALLKICPHHHVCYKCSKIQAQSLIAKRVGAEEACWAHNPKVGGSKLPPANLPFHAVVHNFILRIESNRTVIIQHSFYSHTSHTMKYILLRFYADFSAAAGRAQHTSPSENQIAAQHHFYLTSPQVQRNKYQQQQQQTEKAIPSSMLC